MKKTNTMFVVQYEHDCSKAFEPEDWRWIDDEGWVDETMARDRLRKRRATHAEANNRFTRDFRLVKRTTTVDDEVLADA